LHLTVGVYALNCVRCFLNQARIEEPAALLTCAKRDMTTERTRAMRKQKKAWLAALLNLVPLVGSVAVLLNTFLVSMLARVADVIQFPRLFICIGILELALVLWGLGYLYLRRWKRLVAALCFPWLYALGYLVFPKASSNLPDFYFPYMNEALVVLGVLSLLSGIDAWFLASRTRNRGSVAFDERGLKISKTDPDYVICPSCGMEQWKKYTECQKCGTHLIQA
jgi:hypothetical protein